MTIWNKAFGWAPTEHEFYMGHSQTTHRSYGQIRSRVPVFTVDGVKRMPTTRK